ncbi:MAG: hypothetical protein QXQ57_06550 [Sulfolobales archaeon]
MELPDSLKILYIIYILGGSVDLNMVYETALKASKRKVCCKGYRFHRENGNVYSKDVIYDIEALESFKMIEIIDSNGNKTLKLTQKGYDIVKNIENLLDRRDIEAIISVIKGDKRDGSNHAHALKKILKSIFK